MTTKELLRDVLQAYLDEAKTGPTRLAKLAGVPRKTINHWLSGHVLRPRQWQDLARVAQALHLDEAQTDRLLLAGGHARVRSLLAQAGGEDRALLLTLNGHARVRSLLAQAGGEDRALLLTLNGHARTPTVAPPAPFRAPADLATFVGREAELAELRTALLDVGHAVIYGVRGMGGVGKTALAIHLAYRLRSDFPDGVLWARLDVSDAMTILASFADAYGKDVSQFRDVESRAASVRGVLADKRALLVLDNAETGAQVRPLLPPSEGRCAVLVTTRNDLDATDGWLHYSLEPFAADGDEAAQLFEKLLGRECARRHAEALRHIAAMLGHLPLALAIAGGQLSFALRAAPRDAEHQVVQGMLDDLRLERARLNRLKRDSASVRASFNLSYDRLPTALQQQFAALGVFGGADFSAEAIAFIWNVPIETALADLRTLIARSLLQPSQEGRFRMHPLVRDFARERLGEWSDYHEGVVRRSTDYFAAFVRDHARDFTALDVEIDNALYALRVADEQARDARFLDFARNLYPYFETRGMFDQASQVYQRSREIASQEKDVAALANALYMLASIRLRLAEYDRVIDLCQQGLQVLHEVDRQPLSVKLYRTIGSAYYGRGDFRNSAHYTEQGLIIARDIGDIGQVGDISAGLGMMLFELGQVEEGKARLLEGKQACLQIGNIASASVGCINLSESAMEMGDLANALMYAEEGEALARRIGHRERLANVLADLGDAKSALGCYDEAEDHFQESIALAEPLPWMRGFVLIPYARHLLRTGRIAQAEATAQRSLAEGQRIASNEIIAGAQFVLAKAMLAQERVDQAHDLAREALTAYEAHQPVRAWAVREWINQLP